MPAVIGSVWCVAVSAFSWCFWPIDHISVPPVLSCTGYASVKLMHVAVVTCTKSQKNFNLTKKNKRTEILDKGNSATFICPFLGHKYTYICGEQSRAKLSSVKLGSLTFNIYYIGNFWYLFQPSRAEELA